MNSMPKEIQAILLRLEAKQVLRGNPSTLFPGMTEKEAQAIRAISVLVEVKNDTQTN